MKKIKLANNKGIVLVDDEDYEILNHYKWHLQSGYAAYGHKSITMHRLLMNQPKNMEIDHIDNNRLNNQRDNLRIVTSQQNSMNRSKLKNCSSKYKGVFRDKVRNKWKSCVTFNNKKYHLGYFINEKDAAIA